MKQRRRFKRTNIQSLARITAMKDDSVTGPFNALIFSIGYGGMGVRSKRPIESGSQIECVVTIVDLNGKIRRETVHGKVVWEADLSPYFMSGIQFISLNSNDHPGLMSFLDAQKKEFERLNLHVHETQTLTRR